MEEMHKKAYNLGTIFSFFNKSAPDRENNYIQGSIRRPSGRQSAEITESLRALRWRRGVHPLKKAVQEGA